MTARCVAAHHVSSTQTPSFRGSGRPAAVGESPPHRGGKAPTSADAERRTRWLALRQSPSLQRKGTAGPSRGPARLSALRRGVFPQTSRPPSGNGQGRPTDGTPLIPRDFTRVHPLPPARCRTDPCSWAGRCLPRPPEARLARPNPQAPHPPRSHASHENALGRVDGDIEHQPKEQIKNLIGKFWGKGG
jgi:hypothetical protein